MWTGTRRNRKSHFQQHLCQYSEREKHHEIISSALRERKEILQYKHTNGLHRDLREDCWGIRAGCIREKKKARKETGFSGRFPPNRLSEKCKGAALHRDGAGNWPVQVPTEKSTQNTSWKASTWLMCFLWSEARETMERKVSSMLILCTNLWSLLYLPAHPSLKITATAMPIKHQQLLQQHQSFSQESDTRQHCSRVRVRVVFVLTCLSSQTKLSGMEIVFMFKMWYGRRVDVPKVRRGNAARELCADKGGMLPQTERRMENCGQDKSRSRGKQSTQGLWKYPIEIVTQILCVSLALRYFWILHPGKAKETLVPIFLSKKDMKTQSSTGKYNLKWLNLVFKMHYFKKDGAGGRFVKGISSLFPSKLSGQSLE